MTAHKTDNSPLSDMETRLRVLEDINAINTLMATYLDASDGGWSGPSHDGASVEMLFDEDAVWECRGVAKVVGRSAIRALWERSRETTPFAFHVICNPNVYVSGDRARGEWRMLALVTSRYAIAEADEAATEKIAAANYHNQFKRVDGRWLFESVFVDLIFLENFADGWAFATQLTR